MEPEDLARGRAGCQSQSRAMYCHTWSCRQGVGQGVKAELSRKVRLFQIELDTDIVIFRQGVRQGVKFGSNLGPIAAKLGTKPGTRTQNKAKRTNKIDFVVTLCKQGVAGSSPATSTNHHHFNQMPSEFSRVTTCYSGRGREFERPHVHQLNPHSHIDLRCFFLGTFLPQSRDNRYNRSKNKRQKRADTLPASSVQSSSLIRPVRLRARETRSPCGHRVLGHPIPDRDIGSSSDHP